MKQLIFATRKAVICWLGMSVMVFSYVEIDDYNNQDPGYENTIVAIQEFTGRESCKLVLTFHNDDPVCIYSPHSFAESLDTTIYRIFMPRTKLDDSVTSSFDLHESENGIELVLHGKSLKKIISGNIVVFQIEK